LGRAVVLGIVPFLMLAHRLSLQEGWRLPGLLNRFYFYLETGPQWALAIMLGLAVAAGFPRDKSGSPLRQEQP
jgi:hypothetical protein